MKKILITLAAMITFLPQVFAAHWPAEKTLSVYIEPNNKEYSMKKAFNKWETISRGTVAFEFTEDKANANIKVVFVEQIGGNTAGQCKWTQRGNIITGATIELSKKIHGAAQSNNDYYRVMLHEIGHALGLPHTNRLNSIMNPTTEYAQLITGKDVQDLQKLYEED